MHYWSYLHVLAGEDESKEERDNKCEIMNLIMNHPNFQNIDLNIKDREDFSPLMVAVREWELEKAQILIEHGADVNIVYRSKQEPFFFDGQTALTIACQKFNVGLIKLLIDYGVDLDCQCFLDACDVEDEELMRLLIKKNCNLNDITEEIYVEHVTTYLHTIAYESKCKELNQMMKNPNLGKIDLNVLDHRGFTPLMVAIEAGNINMAKLLLDYGANVNIISKSLIYGQTTALHLTLDTANVKLFEKLFERTNFDLIDQLATRNNLVEEIFKKIHLWSNKANGIKMLLKCLSHRRLLPYLQQIENILYKFFSTSFHCRPTKYGFRKILLGLLDLGCQFKTKDFIFYTNIGHECSEKSLELFVRQGRLNIDDEKILSNILSGNKQNLIFDCMKYCIKHNYLFSIEKWPDLQQNDNYLIVVKLLRFCTPTPEQLRQLCTVDFQEKFDNRLKEFKRFPSLTELARDAARRYIGTFVKNSKEYIEFMDRFFIHRFIRDIITLRQPIYDCF